MKFSDGYWMLRDGVTASYPAEARHLIAGDGALVVHAPVRAVRERGDTLNTAVLTITFTAPLPGVIGVRIVHHAGQPDLPPHLEVAREPGHRAGPPPRARAAHPGTRRVRLRPR